MAKKRKSAKRSAPKRKVKKYAGKTEKEWSEWGEEFGKQMENIGEEFEKHGKKYRSRWFETFGFIAPLIGSIAGLFFLIIGIWLLNAMNLYLMNAFISMLSDFLFTNIQIFFLASLFFSYCNYFSKRYSKNYWILSPLVNSLNIIFVIWILASIMVLVGLYTWVYIISDFSRFLLGNLFMLFIAFALIGYVFELLKRTPANSR